MYIYSGKILVPDFEVVYGVYSEEESDFAHSYGFRCFERIWVFLYIHVLGLKNVL